MALMAAFCREQAALHLAKAANEPLENRGKISLAAAKAWSAEAVLAERREAKQRPLDKLDTKITQEFAAEAEAEAEADMPQSDAADTPMPPDQRL
jgi:hypothetical protein